MNVLWCVFLAACAADPVADPADDGPADDDLTVVDLKPGCAKMVHVWFEPTSGMDAITTSNGCWTFDNMVAGAEGWGWCNEINGTTNVRHAPPDVTSWFFDDTNPVRTAALDTQQITACYRAMPQPVAGVEVMARRYDASTGTTHWQKLVVTNASGWIVNHWIAELHASADDVASYLPDWRATPRIGHPQVNARNDGATCDARVGAAVRAVCDAVRNGSHLSVVKNDGRLAYDSGCLTHVVEALNACTAQ
jgi:hypothetical protein